MQSPAIYQQQQPGVSNPNNAAAASPQTPQPPERRDQQRIALLFEINVALLQEVRRLQAAGQGGAINPQQQAALRAENKPDTLASEDYIQAMRRVQANLAYLMPKAQPSETAKVAPGPAHMTPPPHMAQLVPLYERLRALFPAWQGLDYRMAGAAAASPRPNGGGNAAGEAQPQAR